MSGNILDGTALAKSERQRIKGEVARLVGRSGVVPRLEVILVGDDPASGVYVRNKTRACDDVGMRGGMTRLPSSVSQAELLSVIAAFNVDPTVHGILVQLPLPRHIEESAVIDAIHPLKDVDAFHPENVGRMVIGRPRFVPCTPLGIQRMLAAYDVVTRGKRAVVLGRSNIVGKPMALLLMAKGEHADATVTVCHTATPDGPAIAREADVLIVAIGRPRAVTREWVKPGAVVIDVGMHRTEDGKYCGDVAFDDVSPVASKITPVPGGVGPMTVAMLLENTLKAAIIAAEGEAS